MRVDEPAELHVPQRPDLPGAAAVEQRQQQLRDHLRLGWPDPEPVADAGSHADACTDTDPVADPNAGSDADADLPRAQVPPVTQYA